MNYDQDTRYTELAAEANLLGDVTQPWCSETDCSVILTMFDESTHETKLKENKQTSNWVKGWSFTATKS